MRVALALGLILMLTGARGTTLDAAESIALVNAAPSDFRAILAAMLALLFLQTIERWWSGFRAGKTAEKFAVAADKLTEAVTALSGSHAISSVHLQGQITALAAEIRRLQP